MMAWKNVDNYYLGYNITNKRFSFYYHLQGEASVKQILTTPQEFVALADMFRNEKPISFNTDGNYFATSAEITGEGES